MPKEPNLLDDIWVHPEIEKAHTLPSKFYQNQAIYDLCLERLFAPSWQYLGETSIVKVPGAVYPLNFLEGSLNEPLILTRDMGDKLHLISNVCTHRGNLVCEGAGNERFLRCRYHGRRFDLAGKFVSMPEFEGVTNFPSEADNLANLQVGKWGNLLFGSLAANKSLKEVLGPLQERLDWLPLHEFRLDPTRVREYLVRAHWALYVDNYLEGFHIPFIHPELNQAIDYDNYSYELFETGNLQLAIAKPGDSCFEIPHGMDRGRQIAAYYYWIFPNMMFNFYPWGLSINIVRPMGPDLTRVSFIPYVWQEDRLAEGAGAAIDKVEREDEAVVELVQKGVKSRFYNRGRYSPTKEIGTHHFHQLIAKALNPC
ncbi:MAG TPA: aromatic ring-hydroxylating dioxygenase subunit alpha [Fimbriimonadaceae bacterium]|jgi:choline monooxygenase